MFGIYAPDQEFANAEAGKMHSPTLRLRAAKRYKADGIDGAFFWREDERCCSGGPSPATMQSISRMGDHICEHYKEGIWRVSEASIDPAAFRDVLGSYPTGVCVVATLDDEDNPTGMVIGSFTSVSLDPPLVGFLPDKKSSSWPLIEKAGHFCVNVLASDQQQICQKVATKGPDKFVGVEYTLSSNRLPVIAGSIAVIECRIRSITDAGDHWFVLADVLTLETTREDDPMLFHRGRYGGFAEIE